MNYGKFFRLNLKASKVVDGVTIYDYIDLPAYFGKSKSISPKYPISAVVTKDVVRFQLQYCAYKVSTQESVKYFYMDEDAFQFANNNEGADVETVHMQEVILELPYMQGPSSISEIISHIYDTVFPQLSEEDSGLQNEGFLNVLLKKRFTPESFFSHSDNSLESESYKLIHRNNDSDRSFSTIWLMDLQKKNKSGESIIDLTESKQHVGFLDSILHLENKLGPKAGGVSSKNNYIGVLRKLFLDFMFDLSHSDVFQSSASYNEMYSSLMSDFTFSSLMHKCEYYYYRGITLDVINSTEQWYEERLIELINNKDRHARIKVLRKEREEKLKQIKLLYATHLFEAEKKWVADIIHPQADIFFERPHDDFSDEFYKNKDRSTFRIFDYWFAPPEEEMRRICFTTHSRNSQYLFAKRDSAHLCNAETIAQYLSVKDTTTIHQLRTTISQWFFKRFDFSDALHLHIFKGANIIEFLFLVIAIGSFILFPHVVSQSFWESYITENTIHVVSGVSFSILLFAVIVAYTPFRRVKWLGPRMRNKHELWPERTNLTWRRIFAYLLCVVTFIVAIIIGSSEKVDPPIKITVGISAIVVFLVFIIRGQWISNIHVLYPRLIAAITAAWLSLAIGNELFSAFFDAVPSYMTCILLATIVFLFLLYEINRRFPLINRWDKVFRCLQMLAFSYVISLLVGLFIVNFTAERFLERSDYLTTYYEEYLDNSTPHTHRDTIYFTGRASSTPHRTNDDFDKVKGIENAESESRIQGEIQIPSHEKVRNRVLLDELQKNDVPNAKQKHPIASKWYLGSTDFFILRDFLIQFAFLAMFIGVFIQMIFEEKSITEM